MSDTDRSKIVCPLCLATAIKSEGRLGAIQSFRCTWRPNLNKGEGAWECRPQKGDKWASDHQKIVTSTGEVTLSDGETVMSGLGRTESDKRFEFTQADGEAMYQRAIQEIKAGNLRAPKNWDRAFASEAGMSLDELKTTYPEMYQSTRPGNGKQTDEREVESIASSLLGDGPSMEPEDESLSLEDQELMEEEADEIMEAEEEPAYSVTSELLDEPQIVPPTMTKTGGKKHLKINEPTNVTTLHAGTMCIRADMGGEYVKFFKVKDPESGKSFWLHEGENQDLSDFHLTVR